MLLKRGQVLLSPEKCPLIQTLMKSRGGRPANSDHTAINKVSEEFTCRKSSIFNIAIAFLFSFIRYVTARAPFQEFCLNAFLSYFSFLNLDQPGISREQMFSYYLKKTRRRPGHLSGWTMLDWCREWGSQRLEMLKGQAESDLSWGDGVREWVVEPTQWSRRFLAKLAGLEVSPQYSNPHSRPTSPHPPGARGRHSFHTQNTPSPSWMYFPGQLSVIQLRFCRLCIFQAPKLQSFPTVWL